MPIKEVLTPLRPSVTWSAPLLSLRGLSAARTTRLVAAKAPTAAADCPRKSRRDSWLDMIVLLWKKSIGLFHARNALAVPNLRFHEGGRPSGTLVAGRRLLT